MRHAIGILAAVAAATAWTVLGCQAAGAGRAVSQGGGSTWGDVGPAAHVTALTVDATPGQVVALTVAVIMGLFALALLWGAWRAWRAGRLKLPAV